MGVKLAVFVAFIAAGIACLIYINRPVPCSSTARLDGKTVVITGANTGIGKETAVDLARRGGRIILACRSMERCNSAASEVMARSKVTSDKVKVMKLDLASLKSVKQFSDAYHREEKRLDVLINNAGVLWSANTTTDDGFEATFGINHLGHFHLTTLLLDVLKASAPSRVVTVSSLGHWFTWSLGLETIMDTMKPAAYAKSKLANVLFSSHLAERLKGSGVTTYSLHPGSINTELYRNIFIVQLPGIKQVFDYLCSIVLKDEIQGSQTTICCAVDETLAQETGKYYSECAETMPSFAARDPETARQLWEYSEKLVQQAN